MSTLSLDDIRIWYPVRHGIFNRVGGYVRAVDGVTLSLQSGETVGLVGESGCGKTTLGRGVLGLEPLHSGKILLDGEMISSLSERKLRPYRRRIQMIFQDPYSSLNPRMTIMELLTEGIRFHGLLEGRSLQAAAGELMEDVGLDPRAMYRYPHEFSGGQRQRISIARAISLRPSFIVCDEPVSALDVSVQAQILNLLMELKVRHGLSYLFISHNLNVVRQISDRIAVMYLGRLVEVGPADEVMSHPGHPYTQALLSAIPVPGQERLSERIILKGEIPSPMAPPQGCHFHPRCPYATDECRCSIPACRPVDSAHADHLVACHKQ